MDYDVIIAGGSFGGLAAAVQLRGRRVLLIEPHPIGAVQSSACGTLLAVLEITGALDSLLQIHDHFTLHLGNRLVEYSLPYLFCTFDYRAFCRRLLEQCDVDILPASALSHRGHLVYTTHGVFDAEILIDASGWRAALSTNSQAQAQRHQGKSFGLETVVPVPEEGLHFYYDSSRLGLHNVGWLFPTGATSRAGFASYQGHTHLNQALVTFLRQRFGQSPGDRHGGYFPYRRQPATSGKVFRVGDAAGQCLPLTGEGIRPALFYGAKAGRLARRVLDGEMGLDEALVSYRKLAAKRQQVHHLMLAAQKIFPALPMGWIKALAGWAEPEERIHRLMELYWKVIDLNDLEWLDRDKESDLVHELWPYPVDAASHHSLID